MTTRHLSVLFTGAALAGLAGCEDDRRGPESGLPDERLLVQQQAGDQLARGVHEPSAAAAATLRMTSRIDALLGSTLSRIGWITLHDPTEQTDDAVFWGPLSLSEETAVRLRVNETETGDRLWTLHMGHPGSMERVAWGTVVAGSDEISSAGSFTIDYDALSAVDGSAPAAGGELTVYYTLEEGGAEGELTLTDWSRLEDGLVSDQVVEYDTHDEGYVNWSISADLDGDGPGNPDDVVRIHSRFQQNGAGRMETTLRGEDAAPPVRTTECWGGMGNLTFYETSRDATATLGTEEACVLPRGPENAQGL